MSIARASEHFKYNVCKQIYTRNTSISETILTEHLLHARRRPQTSGRARKPPHNQAGQKKKEKKKRDRKESGLDLRPWEGAVQKESFLHPGKSPYRREDQPGWKQSFGAPEKNAATSLRKAKWTVTGTGGLSRCPVLASLRHSAAGLGRRGAGC